LFNDNDDNSLSQSVQQVFDGYLLPEGSGNTTVIPFKLEWGSLRVLLVIGIGTSIETVLENYLGFVQRRKCCARKLLFHRIQV